MEGGYQVLVVLWLMLGVCSFEEERSRIIAVQIDIIRSLLGIRMMDRVPNARIR